MTLTEVEIQNAEQRNEKAMFYVTGLCFFSSCAFGINPWVLDQQANFVVCSFLWDTVHMERQEMQLSLESPDILAAVDIELKWCFCSCTNMGRFYEYAIILKLIWRQPCI